MNTINSFLSTDKYQGPVCVPVEGSNPFTPITRRVVVTPPQLDRVLVEAAGTEPASEEVRVQVPPPPLHYKSQPLDNKSSLCPSSRGSKWDALRFQRKFNPRKGMRLCGCSPASHTGSFRIGIEKREGRSTSYKNRKLCKSYWCPVCSDIFRRDKREKIRLGLNNAMETNKSIYFLTFTIPRNTGSFGDKFEALNSVVRALWNRLRNKIKREGNKLWTIKGLDLTVRENDRNPLHLHTHAVIVLDQEIEGLKGWLWSRYKSLMEKLGIQVSRLGYDFQKVTKNTAIDEYIAKNWENLDKELTSTDKGSSTESLGYFRWLKSISKNPSERQIKLYQAFIYAAKGRRTMDFSRNWEELSGTVDTPEEEKAVEISKDFSSSFWEAVLITKSEEAILSIIDGWYVFKRDKASFDQLNKLFDIIDPFEYYSKDLIERYSIYLENIKRRRYYAQKEETKERRTVKVSNRGHMAERAKDHIRPTNPYVRSKEYESSWRPSRPTCFPS